MPVSLFDFLAGGIVQGGFGTLAVFFLTAMQLMIFSVTLYLHRWRAHRAVGFPAVLALAPAWT